ncbi:unnamed protein product [Moneuplotes crassus]|uniref:Uncharacterized protein n=1 Tax=Euplotes crassus TaxID=5936 RepID=A0AAD1UFX2_EUPCR|nr:unnamed protein product [Moneuplotes crassus]
MDYKKGKRKYFQIDAVSSDRMRDSLFDSKFKTHNSFQRQNPLQKGLRPSDFSSQNRRSMRFEAPEDTFQPILKEFNPKVFSKRLKSVSSDNFFKYKDFYGAGAEIISESPNKCHPTLKDVIEQKSAGFESELTRKLKNNKLISPFEWKMNSNTPHRPFRDRFKFGNNKICGKVTDQNEENTFKSMQIYLEKEKKKNELATRLTKLQQNSCRKTASQHRFDNGDTTNEGRNLQNDLKLTSIDGLQRNTLRRHDHSVGRVSPILKILPKIKSERKIKADKWRKTKNRVKGQCSEEASSTYLLTGLDVLLNQGICHTESIQRNDECVD